MVACVLLLPGMALAQQARQGQQRPPQQEDIGQMVNRNLQSCIGSAQEPARIRSCIDGQRAALEPRLNAVMQRYLDTQPSPDRRAGAEQVQQAWAAYRDRRCDFAGSNPQRGEEAQIDRAACMLQFTIGRIGEVEAVINPPPAPPGGPQGQPPRR